MTSENSKKRYYTGIANTVFTKDAYGIRDLDAIINIYKEAIEFGLKNQHPVYGGDVTDMEPPIHEKYKELANKIKTYLGEEKCKDYKLEYYNFKEEHSFFTLMTLVLRLIETIFEKYNIERSYLQAKYDVMSEADFLVYCILVKQKVNDYNYIFNFLEEFAIKLRNEYKASQQKGGKIKKDKIKMKEDSKQYVVHLTDKKQKFIKRKGSNVLLSSIRGKYNYVT